jgi:hypothetical protein
MAESADVFDAASLASARPWDLDCVLWPTLRNMYLCRLFLASILFRVCAAFDFLAAFDSASSSSVYNAVGGAGAPLFAAIQAASPGGGYWCSASARPSEALCL